ncbi:hypothetical protein TL16_g05610 [Triparma laevis f. inornata]|uniref:Mitochondrial carrier n=1 Tax=Triparma laevis f. inornata TaxID=1714386 RepID=A0A9W7AJW6_9STRA|nr:hypothetical protein TL16_g05610 [Triparma laevis f. inornata]
MSTNTQTKPSSKPKYLPNKEQTPLQILLTASTTGAILTALLVSPLDVLKVRQQTSSFLPRVTTKYVGKNVVVESKLKDLVIVNAGITKCLIPSTAIGTDCAPKKIPTSQASAATQRLPPTLSNIIRTEGVTSLYRGLTPSLIMAVPSTAVYFTAYERLRQITDPSYTWLTSSPFLCGSFARTLSTTCVTPLELVRTRWMNISASVPGHTLTDELRTIFLQSGFRGLFHGLNVTLMRDVPFSGVYWLSVEKLRQEGVGDFLGGMLSGIIASCFTTPFDVVKTRMQVRRLTARTMSSEERSEEDVSLSLLALRAI